MTNHPHTRPAPGWCCTPEPAGPRPTSVGLSSAALAAVLRRLGPARRRRQAEPFFPPQGLAHDLIEIVVLGNPSKVVADLVGRGDDDRRVAGPSPGAPHIEVATRNALDRVDHLEHRETTAVPAVVDVAGAAGTQVL